MSNRLRGVLLVLMGLTSLAIATSNWIAGEIPAKNRVLTMRAEPVRFCIVETIFVGAGIYLLAIGVKAIKTGGIWDVNSRR